MNMILGLAIGGELEGVSVLEQPKNRVRKMRTDGEECMKFVN